MFQRRKPFLFFFFLLVPTTLNLCKFSNHFRQVFFPAKVISPNQFHFNNIYMYLYVFDFNYIYMCVCACVRACVCACVCVCVYIYIYKFDIIFPAFL